MTSLRRLSFILCTTDDIFVNVSTVRTVIETKAATQRVKLTIATKWQAHVNSSFCEQKTLSWMYNMCVNTF